MENKVIEVRFKCKQGAEDLFYSPETKRVYARQIANVEDKVFWYTTCKWTGGYEADCPIREGITMRVLDYKGRTRFEETLEIDNWNGGTSAKKMGYSSDELLKRIYDEVNAEHELKRYEDWSKWICSFQEEHGYTGYRDNWMFWEAETTGYEVLKEYEFFDGPIYLYREERRHKICGKSWTEYEIRRKGYDETMVLCGYDFCE